MTSRQNRCHEQFLRIGPQQNSESGDETDEEDEDGTREYQCAVCNKNSGGDEGSFWCDIVVGNQRLKDVPVCGDCADDERKVNWETNKLKMGEDWYVFENVQE